MKHVFYGGPALLALSAAVLLSGCGQPADNSASDTEQAASSNVQAQLNLIAGSKDLWFLPADYANEVYACAVTDLDQNGRLELIAAHMGGTGLYTYASFYEVNETFDALEPCDYAVPEGDSEADLITDAVPVYYDADSGALYYIFDDTIRNGAAELYQNKRALSLTQGAIQTLPLAWKATIYEDAEAAPEITCKDQTGSTISEAAYDAIAKTVFEGLEQKTAHFGWYQILGSDMETSAEMDTSAWEAVLQTSYEAFSLS